MTDRKEPVIETDTIELSETDRVDTISVDEFIDNYLSESYQDNQPLKTFIEEALEYCLDEITISPVVDDDGLDYDFDYQVKVDEVEHLRLSHVFIRQCEAVYWAFKAADKDHQTMMWFVRAVWDRFCISEIERKNIASIAGNESPDIVNALEYLSLLPSVNFKGMIASGNKKIGFTSTNGFEWEDQDELISIYLDWGVMHEGIAWKLLTYRVSAESWIYHCECMTKLAGLMSDQSTPIDRAIYSRTTAEKFHFCQKEIIEAVYKSKWLFSFYWFLALSVFGLLLLFVSDEFGGSTSYLLGFVLLGLALLRPAIFISASIIRWLISKIIPLPPFYKKHEALDLSHKMSLFSIMLEQRSIDLTGTLHEYRALVSAGAAFPGCGVSLLQRHLDNQIYHFDHYNAQL